jgi:PAS domain S-box-containing protein
MAYFIASGAIVLALLFRLAAAPWLLDRGELMPFLIAVLVSACYGGLRPGLLATALGALVGTYVLLPPEYSLQIAAASDRLQLALFCATSLGICWVCDSLHAARRRSQGEQRRLEQSAEERKRIEEAQARLAAIVETSDDAIISKDLNGIIRTWNEGAQRIFGYRADEIVGRPITVLIPAERVGEEEQILAKLRRGERCDHLETVRVAKDGRRIDVSVTISPLKDGQGRVVGASKIARDVSEQKRAAAQLQRNHDTFFALIQNNPFGIYVVDADFKIGQVSLGAQKVFAGVLPLIGRDFGEVLRILWPAAFAADVLARFRHTLDSGEPYAAPRTIERRRDIDEIEAYDWRIERITLPDGRPGVVCYFYDLSERQRWETALRQSEERLRLATDASRLGIWTWRPDDDVVVWENARPNEIFALSPNEAPLTAARFMAEFVHRDDVASVEQALARAAQGEAAIAFQCRILRADAELRWIEFTGKPVHKEDGQSIDVIGTVQDISERKQDEEALRRLAAELSTADRRKNEFLAVLAHELRNPLAPISNGLQILRLSVDQPKVVEATRAMLERQHAQLVRLVDDLLDVARINQQKLQLRRQRVDLRGVLDQAAETTRPLIDSRAHDFAVHLPSEPLDVDADVTRLVQVFANLINNAAKFSARGGRIGLTARREGNEAVVSVEDNGVGIPPEMLPNVFEMFVQVDRSLERSESGLGIGLTLVKRLVQMHGGLVQARSEGAGRGSEFTVRLPLLASPAQAAVPPARELEPASTAGRRRILVADDNEDAAASMAMMLELMGNDVQTANDGWQALQVAAVFRPDVILLDIGMPKLNGYEACRRIRQQSWSEKTILIALTGWGQDEDKRRAQEAGFSHHLVKPVDFAALETLLRLPGAPGD